MTSDTRQVVDLCERLPPARRAEVADFARSLLAREVGAAGQGDPDEDAAWERIVDDPRPRPELDAFVQAALAEGSEPLDPDTL